MTTPTTATKSTPAKSTKPKVEETVTASDNVNTEETKQEEVKNRIPDYLASNTIFAEFCSRYLDALDEIAEYNKEVLAEKSSEWNSTKVMAKARELGNPEDAKTEPVKEIKDALDEFDKALTAFNLAKKAVINTTAKELGITLDVKTERDPEKEEDLKKKRKFASAIGSHLNEIATMTRDEKATSEIQEFLAVNGLPAVGRDQVHNFGVEGTSSSTPKYRVNVTVIRQSSGEELIKDASGFTKASLALPKYMEHGKALKPEVFRQAWEAAGNAPGKTVKETVEFEQDGLHFIITAK